MGVSRKKNSVNQSANESKTHLELDESMRWIDVPEFSLDNFGAKTLPKTSPAGSCPLFLSRDG